ncbi:MAG: hypothetical protein HQ513_06540 [Rhodospirillales bacterium]|nr:hypothetical protein [Rhodospirillales bacterium]
MAKRFLLILTALAATLFGPLTATADTAQAIGNASQLCDSQAARVEQAAAIPRHLLKAISLAETGRWDGQRQENFAWPWTVTALGKGNYFADKEAALHYVRKLKARGITNIDVGCMQINLFYHGDAFPSLEHAIDPATNVTYAGKFLSGLYKSTRSWTKASGNYHSSSPQRAQAYKMKVLKYWNQERKLALTEDRKSIDRAHMAKLNASHKAQKTTSLNSAKENIRSNQLAAWRSPNSAAPDMATLAAMRRAAKQAQWHEKYFSDNKSKGEAFAKKRRKQLKKWRLTRVVANEG